MSAILAYVITYSTLAVTVLFPRWIRDADRVLCRLLSRWFATSSLLVAVVAVYSWTYVEGCRRGWWGVLWSWMTDDY